MILARRILPWFVIASILVSLAPLPRAPVARAIVPVQDVALPGIIVAGFATLNAQIAALNVNRSLSFGQDIFEWAASFLLAAIKQRLIEMIVDQTVRWIQGGGRPQFVTDWKGFLLSAGDAAIGDFAREIGAGALCDPFKIGVKFALGIGIGGPFPTPPFSRAVTCSLSGIVGNVRDFYSDFRRGGWLGFQVMLSGTNNFYGAYLMSSAQLSSMKAEASFTAHSEAVAGAGFLSQKRCTDPNNPSTCRIVTPGDAVAESVRSALGANKDLIVNTEQIAAAAGLIANALLNRLIGSAAGLLGLGAPSAPPGRGYVPPGGADPCAGLTEPALSLCRQNQQQQQGPGGTGTFTSEIDQMLRTVGQATTTAAILRANLNGYLAFLNTTLAQYSGPPPINCVNRQTYIQQLSDDVVWAQDKITGLSGLLVVLQNYEQQLTTARNRILVLAQPFPPQRLQPDIQGINNILNQLRSAGFLNLVAGIGFNNQLAEIQGEVNARINGNRGGHEANIDQCRQGP